ncbi:hypothetical protein GPECTOR_1g893 [Gonium pectorale]|uniref:Uncharacterized protein n=1 Tax=Gonium pectorale TaxID=33097 RepID=A0A150H580_GONPE|nr:hypothetical protein GPECTOR_1g893 [Gonium pectorale]|eukprot:KXZ56988.1 hypothetical protein GPECTOR_1g893 [Gonium pectorale]
MRVVLYTLPVTILRYQFWKEDPSNFIQQVEVLGAFLKNLAIVGGVVAFMSTTDHVPLKVKRKRD